MNIASILLAAGFLSVIVGFILILLSFAGKDEGETKGFGIIFLGPLPIIFGGRKGWMRVLTLLSLVFILLIFLVFFLPLYLGTRAT